MPGTPALLAVAALAVGAAVAVGVGPVPGPEEPPGPPVPASTPSSVSASADRPGRSAAVSRWRWPLRPEPPLLRAFDGPSDPWGPGHRGLDLGARSGTTVHAVEAGVVTHAGTVAGRGTVTVQHADGLRSTYEPVAATVARGDRVAVGAVIGTVEDAVRGHCGEGGCLHLGARRQDRYLDPWPLLTGGRVRLLPLGRP